MFFTLLEQPDNVSLIVSDIVINIRKEKGLNIYHITFSYMSKFNLASALVLKKLLAIIPRLEEALTPHHRILLLNFIFY